MYIRKWSEQNEFYQVHFATSVYIGIAERLLNYFQWIEI